jgi:predicted TPR repeat methyltransferase
MFGAKRRIGQYLLQVKPWAVGKNSRGWYSSDFADKKVKAERLNPAAVIFPLPTLTVSSLDRFLLPSEVWQAVMNFQHAASNFNALLSAVNCADDKQKDVKYKLITALHVGAIGSRYSGGLFDAFTNLFHQVTKK